MNKLSRLALVSSAALMLATSITSAASAADAKIGYLGLENDARYQPQFTYTRIELENARDPSKGAEMGLSDMQQVAGAVGLTISLDEQKAPDLASLVAKVQAMNAAGERFILLDLPGDLVDQVAAQTKDLPVTLINTTADDDYLRNRCYPNLLHTAASDRMKADALVQYLRTRNFNNILMLVGPNNQDKELADTFRKSAERLRLNIVDQREFTLALDPANREQNNTQLLTGGADYDVVFIADSQGEYARYLPYNTQLPRPIIGSAGLTPAEWHWSWDRDGSTQVTIRFEELTNGRHMDGGDWSTWVAVKAVVQAYAKARSDDPAKVDEFLRGDRLKIDGSKGVTMSFRSWDGQLRQPIVLATYNAVIAEAPLEGFLHQTNTLDTLGTDEPEHTCQ